jgi:murein L,D-transpeptidase YafK
MNIALKTILVIMTIISSFSNPPFKAEQLKFERVKYAYGTKWEGLQRELQKAGVKNGFQLYLAAYKNEGKFELWLKAADQSQFRLFKTYDFCAHSGTLGPKVIEGDGQTPEGFYKINVFNPQSSYHLSLGVDYPNKVDMTRTGKNNKPGGDIYIHGNCVTIGCIPLTDQKIEEVYIIAVEAKNGGQKEIPINIFPFRMTDENLKKYGSKFPAQIHFWKNLQLGYAYFEKHKVAPKINQAKGSYVIN